MAVVLFAVGAFLYVRLGNSLEEQLEDSLQIRTDALSALVQARRGDVPGRELASAEEEGFAQVIEPDGSLAASSPSMSRAPLVSPGEVERARGGSFYLHRDVRPADEESEPAKLLVSPVEVQGETLVLVVGAPLEDREEALEGLLNQLFVVGPLALVLSSLAGYLLAAAALRPVEAMRRRATQVSSEHPETRLPLPESRDEIRRLGETLNAMLDRLEAGLARERRFVADTSHELRTPLALLKAELELALRRPRSREDLEHAIRSAAEEVDRLTQLAEDLLVLARVDEDRLALRRAPVPVRDLLDSVSRRFAARAAAEGRELRWDADAGGALDVDRLRLEQALGNLVDNALRYGAGTIRLESERRDGRVELRVSDEGAGFPPSFLPRALDRFTRADEARGRGASGLGLAIVDAIARAHGGTAHAANGAGRGAVVSVTLPAGDGRDG